QPSDVQTMIVQRPGESEWEEIRRASDGGWTLTIGRSEGAAGPPWPLNPSNVRGLLGVLRNLTAAGAPPEGNRELRPALSLRIFESDEKETVVTFDERAIGGRRLVEVDGETRAFIGQDVFEALAAPGPRGWRESSALPNVLADAARLQISAADQQIALRRIGNRWMLASPLAARASGEKVDEVRNAMSSIAIADFLDAGLPENDVTQLNAPVLALAAEKDNRVVDPAGGEPRVETERRELLIGAAADVSGATRYALGRPGNAPLLVRTDSLQRISVDPLDYVELTSTSQIPSSIGAMLIEPVSGAEFARKRTENGWSALDDAGASADGGVAPLLTLLAESPAAGVSFEAPDGYIEQGRLTLLDLGDEMLERFAWGVAGDFFVIHNLDEGGAGGVYRLYEQAQRPDLLRTPASAG
ncbi:MAG: hypothetical protein VYC34_00365, partial [Planctomycetota bacterium]|nr:hypothetical protein [Planctomycetota bacterium]